MFEKPTLTVGVSQRVVATLVACAVVMFTVGYHTIAQAANLTNISDTLSDSEPSVTAAHTIAFTIPTGSSLGAGDSVTINFETGFTDVATVVLGDLTVTVDAVAATPAGFSAVGQDISFNNVTATAGQEVIVAIADGKIVNPAAIQSYEITVDTGTGGDTGKTRVAIVNNVLVTAIIPTVFDFVITGLATSTVVNGDATTGSTTATAVPFAELAADTAEVLGQQLSVTTNARNGFVVTVEQDDDFRSAAGGVIDSFTDGTYVDTPAAWAQPGGGTPTISDDTTWGHWGITSSDADLNGDEFGSALYIAASTTPRVIFSHASSSDGVTDFIGSTTIGYKVEVSALQEAGDDYQTILTYIATPTF